MHACIHPIERPHPTRALVSSLSTVAPALWQGAEIVLRCFAIPLAAIVILAERESTLLLQLCAFLDSWLLKGFYIIL